ncbi:TonB-dependent receptor [Catenovulum agarivorans]|uniref:TonB-dependent receptor n=1 Tax=Catenovulum agarivorans TaxID=1172192 RepID=UPI00031D09B0|nr:TonB-dependent receptor [Catenovulum agarivorans]
MKNIFNKKTGVAIAITAALNGYTGLAVAQEGAEEVTETIEIKGIRSALASALNQKRDTTNLTEIIKAEDIGKLPDNNLAEVLENITGVQIDRTAGVGTRVQIRGTDANRVEINGIGTVGSGSDRTGISFEDLPAAIIAAVEVTKAPTAKTIEGSVGGTVNLKTIRANSLKERLLQFRVQGEHSDVADSVTPRISGSYGDNWDTDLGKFGVVVTASYAEQDVASVNPRFDRDRVVMPDSGRASAEDFAFMRTQFLDQPIRASDYETKNFTTSIEFAPTQDLKFYFDATINDQEEAGKGSRAYFSGTGANPVIDNTNNTEFETVKLGSVDGMYGNLDLGEIRVVKSGVIGIGGNPNEDPNLRIDGNTGSRLTKSRVFGFGSEWTTERLKLNAEVSYADSDTKLPGLNSTLDFINPNAQQPGPGLSNDNGTPAIFNIKGNTFEFGIAPGLDETPDRADLLNPANYALRGVSQILNTNKGDETAFRVDVKYDVSDLNPIFVDFNAGVRWNKATSARNNSNISSSFGNWDRPRANLFSDIVVAGPNNFNSADDRTLFVADYLMIDNDIAFGDPSRVIDTLNQAIATNNANSDANNEQLGSPNVSTSAYFDIEEETTAFYVQGDYEAELGNVLVKGNLGVRYVSTDLTSEGVSEINGQVETVNESASYDFVLPRFNLSAEFGDGLFMRIGAGKDIRRPDFNALSPSATFGNSPSSVVTVGNPALEPEEVKSYDLSFEYYFSDAALVSIGFFQKDRTNLITPVQEQPAEPIGSTGQIERDVTAPCEDGGIFNPNVPPENYNVFSSRTDTFGICVARRTDINASGSETQKGVEIAAQYDLSDFEDQLGWASGFGVIANYTRQEASGGLTEFRSATGPINEILGRTDTDNSTPTLADDVVTQRITLDNLSEDAYNFTLFYDKHDLNVRLRYTWRSAFTKEENVMRFNLPPVIGARGQLNMSVNYDLTDSISVGIEGVNLLREDRTKWCFNEGALLCEQDIADRRMTAGITAKF